MDKLTCPVCSHHCRLEEGAVGRCRGRQNQDGRIVSLNYGKLTALALDPIEKKPLFHYHPGSMILSLGSYGCSMSCPFCQNYSIAQASDSIHYEIYQPEEICRIARRYQSRGNIGIAFTYNEFLISYEYVRDTASLSHEAGMKNVLVTNGLAELPILEEILPFIDAMNIDLKAFRPELYKKMGGDLDMVMAFISRAVRDCHVELTSLIVPGMNDLPEDMDREAAWIASLCRESNKDIPLHISRYFPRYKMKEPPTDLDLMKELQAIASNHLPHVYLGNV